MKPDRVNMKRLIIFALVLLLPSVVSEISHSPDEVGEGDQFTALIDTEDNVVSVTFYVCTLEEPYTCYKPETVERNDTINGRFQFTYEVKNNDYPGYKYELEKDDNSTDKIPASEYGYYEGMNVVKMGDSYYFKINMKSQDSEDEYLLYSPSIISSISILVILVLAGRR
jgi:hypothetical protein